MSVAKTDTQPILTDVVAYWLKTNLQNVSGFSGIDFVGSNVDQANKQNFILVLDAGGQSSTRPDLKEQARLQIFVQHSYFDKAKTIIYSIYRFIADRTHVELPIPEQSKTLTVSRIRAIDRPIPLGSRGTGYQFSINYEFIYFLREA